MQVLGKVADLMILNLLALLCCIPIVTIGASLTAMHYIALKIARNEDYYIVRGFFKSFKENFKQATIVWLLLLLVIVVLVGDYFIISNATMEFPFFVKVVIAVVGFMALLTATFVFPAMARFENPLWRTLKNAFMMSILQFPKTILMIILNVLPVILTLLFPQIFPLAFLFGLAGPAFGGACLYSKFFLKLEDRIRAANGTDVSEEPDAEDEKIFSDELQEGIVEDSEIVGRPQ